MRTFLSVLFSVLIMFFIFTRINLAEFRQYVTHMDLCFFALAAMIFFVFIVLGAYRWQVMIRKWMHISLWESVKLVMASAALNILLPSRVGDLSKGYFSGREGTMDVKRGMNVVFFEKYVDLAALGIVVLTGILFRPEWNSSTLLGLSFGLGMVAIFPVLCFVKLDRWLDAPFFQRHKILGKVKEFLCDSQGYLDEIKKDPKHLAWILFLSLLLWFFHVVQFYLFFLAFHSTLSIFQVFLLVPLAILVGLVPVTMAGVGTRDSAMIYFISPYEKVPVIVGVGVIATLVRYFIPGLIGLLFLNQYIVRKKPR